MRRFEPLALARFAGRFLRAERGATAVEFALVSLPLVTLVMGMLELAIVILVVTTLQTASEYSARMIRTGEFQTSAANTRTDFKALVCSRMGWLNGQCVSNLTVTVQTFPSFNALAANQPMTGQTFVPNTGCFSTGQPGDIVLVRSYFLWRLFTPVLSMALDNTGAGQRLVTTATAFRNEPYNDNAAVGASC